MLFKMDVVKEEERNVFRHVNAQGEEVLFTGLQPHPYIMHATLSIFRDGELLAKSKLVGDTLKHFRLPEGGTLATTSFKGLQDIFKDNAKNGTHGKRGVAKLDANDLAEGDVLAMETDYIKDLARMVKMGFTIKAAVNAVYGDKTPVPESLPRILVI